MYQFLLYNRRILLYLYTSPFFSDSFSVYASTEYWVEYLVLYSRSQLTTHFICNSVHMPTANYQSIPPSHLSPLATIVCF